MTPICLGCRLQLVVEKNGFIVRDPQVGGFPSTYYSGDLMRCPGCGHAIVGGFGAQGYTRDDRPRPDDTFLFFRNKEDRREGERISGGEERDDVAGNGPATE